MTRRLPMEVPCPTGKRRYRDELDAMLALGSLLTAAARIDPTLREAVATVERAVGAALVRLLADQSRTGSGERAGSTHCPICKGWHLTKQVRR